MGNVAFMKLKYVVGFLALCACEPIQTLDEYKPVVDLSRVSAKRFDADLAQCREVAKTAEADYQQRAQKEATNNMVAGLIVGALVGAAAGDNGRYIGAGAAYGGLAGAGAQGDYDHDLVTYGPRRIVDRCMADRGYHILNDVGRG
jgi:hypothetical protein